MKLVHAEKEDKSEASLITGDIIDSLVCVQNKKVGVAHVDSFDEQSEDVLLLLLITRPLPRD